ncbi:hypothetical protein V5P93_003018 [Actinokineospora auranticolor]|uniref:Uncharacterized protein n=1 Tax=Actinokineospora auranticolor TaxID=155976 RepID=A0A2S6H118_9PSEU|nr:hypothetical protein [Actinokineospora auranticolor]PPK71154.1 hypothetical protein CLV40_101343 [Actinokineospora auranticolor]
MSSDGATEGGAPAADQQAASAAAPEGDGGGAGREGEQASAARDEPERQQFSEAYERGRKLTADGPMAFIRDSVVEDMHIGDRNTYYTFASGGRAFRTGSVRKEVLDWVRARYTPVRGYSRMLATLRERNVLVLYGRPDTGRATTALRLLDEVVSGKVSRFDSGKGLSALTEQSFTAGDGYITEIPRAAVADLTELELDRVHDIAIEQTAYLVVICGDSDLDQAMTAPADLEVSAFDPSVPRDAPDDTDDVSEVLGGYAIVCPPPETTSLLRSHLIAELAEGPDVVDPLLDRVFVERRLRDAIGPAPLPWETARMAKLVAQWHRGEIDLPEVETKAAQLLQEQVAEWFSCLSDSSSPRSAELLRMTAFRIALAVFDSSPYELVMDAGNRLAKLLLERTGETGKKEKGALVVDNHAITLPASRGRMYEGGLTYGVAVIREGFARFTDDRFPITLLARLWRHHHNMHDVVLLWLKDLGTDGRPMVWVRAAQATGLFCSLSFVKVFEKTILPCALAEGRGHERERQFAAVALDHAARSPRIADVVYERLRSWRRQGPEPLRYTAAMALRYDLGKQDISRALEELRVLGTPSELRPVLEDWQDSALVEVAAGSLANLLAFGAVKPVLAKLAEWSGGDRQSLRELALRAVLELVRLRGFDLTYLDRSAGRTDHTIGNRRAQWPLLLVLSARDGALTGLIVELLIWALRGRRGDVVATSLLRTWLRAVEHDAACLVPIVDFLPHLVRDHSDTRRLLHVISRLRHDWCDPLDDVTATALEQAITATRTEQEAS